MTGTAPSVSSQGGAGATIAQADEQRSAPIESLRAIAALSVLAGHVVAVNLALSNAAPSTGGQLTFLQRLFYGGGFGVLFFFALTGYLLFLPFARSAFGDGSHIDLRRYATNRAVRILPLYYAVIVFALLALHAGSPVGTWLRFLTFTENFDSGTIRQIVGPAWSLVVELHFYILLPFLALAVAWIARGSLLRAAAVLSALAAISLYFRIGHVLNPPTPQLLWWLNLPTTFMFFVPGMLLALLQIAWTRRPPAWLRGPLARGDVWIAASVPLWGLVIFGSYRLDPLLGLASFLVLGGCVLPLRRGRAVRALSWRPLAILGVASYSLYLWHVPVMEGLVDWFDSNPSLLVLVVIAVPACIGVALVSYRAIEEPFLRLRRQWAKPASADGVS